MDCPQCGEPISWATTCQECRHHLCLHENNQNFDDPDNDSGRVEADCTICHKRCVSFEW